ncbi:NOP58 family protein, partial [Candidatus Woesearchaeota archaeon]
DDQLIIQAVTTLEQIEHVANRLVKKAREWYSLHNPEFEHDIEDHEAFIAKARTQARGVMGGSLSKEDKQAIDELITSVEALYNERERLRAYIAKKMEAVCPNTTALAGPIIGAKLLSHAGSLDRLASVPSSTLQLFGAERALFRHLRNKRHKAPKYGIIFNHPLVQRAGKERGKAARALADKLSLCAKVDRFKGAACAEKFISQLEKRFGTWASDSSS